MGGRKSANLRFFSFALGAFAFFRAFFSSRFRALILPLRSRVQKRESAKKAPAPTSGDNPRTSILCQTCKTFPMVYTIAQFFQKLILSRVITSGGQRQWKICRLKRCDDFFSSTFYRTNLTNLATNLIKAFRFKAMNRQIFLWTSIF